MQGPGTLMMEGGQVALAGQYPIQGAATLAVRPERIELAEPGTHPNERAIGRVDLSTYLGAIVEHVVHLGTDLRVVVRGASSGPAAVPRLRAGDPVALCWDAGSERVFPGADPSDAMPIPSTPTP